MNELVKGGHSSLLPLRAGSADLNQLYLLCHYVHRAGSGTLATATLIRSHFEMHTFWYSDGAADRPL